MPCTDLESESDRNALARLKLRLRYFERNTRKNPWHSDESDYPGNSAPHERISEESEPAVVGGDLCRLDSAEPHLHYLREVGIQEL